MRKITKKIMTALTTMAVIVTSVGFTQTSDSTNAVAATVDNNTSISTAVDISSGLEYQELIGDRDAFYYFVYTAPASGYVSFTLARAEFLTTDTPAWAMYTYDSQMTELDYSHNVEKSYDTPVQMVRAGTKYYLKVYSQFKRAQEIPYMVKANFTPYDYVESEPDDSGSDATILSDGDQYLGVLSSSKDEDFYKVTAPGDGYVKVSIDRYDFSTTDSPEWDINSYDEDMNELYSLSTTFRNNTKNTHQLYHALKKSKSVYYKVSNGSGADGIMYSVTYSFTPQKSIETEPNNDFGSADKIKVGKTVYGSLAEKNTADYFYLKPSKGGKYKVSISLNRDMEYGYRLSIYDSSRDRIATTDQLIFKKGSLVFSAKKGKKYYITIEQGNTWSGYSVGYLYKLKVVKK